MFSPTLTGILLLDDLGHRINSQVQNSLNAFRSQLFFDENLGERINQDVQGSLESLNDLREKIASQLKRTLLPVLAKEIAQKMAGGVGGISVLYFNESKYKLSTNNLFD